MISLHITRGSSMHDRGQCGAGYRLRGSERAARYSICCKELRSRPLESAKSATITKSYERRVLITFPSANPLAQH